MLLTKHEKYDIVFLIQRVRDVSKWGITSVLLRLFLLKKTVWIRKDGM